LENTRKILITKYFIKIRTKQKPRLAIEIERRFISRRENITSNFLQAILALAHYYTAVNITVIKKTHDNIFSIFDIKYFLLYFDFDR
jgi:hypothetical protein